MRLFSNLTFVSSLARPLSIALFFLSIPFSSAYSSPSGEKIIHGDVSIQKTENNQNLIITSSSSKSIIEWQSFSIAQDEHTHFQLPSKDSASLNRVTGNNISEIYGRLSSNGSIYLINPSGILIGKTGIIQTQSFIATTLSIDNQEFLQGDPLHISGSSDKMLKNEGFVEALEGNIFFIAKEVSNAGHLKASEGNVSLTAASSVVLLLQDKNHPEIIIKKESSIENSDLLTPLKETPSVENTETQNPSLERKIENSGLIEAVQVELTSSGYNLSSLAINQSGLIQARGFEEKEGKILLFAEAGITKVSGTLEAATIPALSNKNSIQGGEIQVLGDHVHVTEGAKLIASGDLDGGSILIGGDFQGKNPEIKNALTTTVEHGSLIDVSSFNGNAGSLVLWSDNGTFFDGEILATSVLGDGGFVEVSSHGILKIPGFVDTRSIHGKTGTLLLDPWDITISGGATTNVSSTAPDPIIDYGTATGAILNVTDLTNQLATNNVKIDSDYAGTGGEAGNITIAAGSPISWSSSNYLELYAAGSIIVNDSITSTTGNIILTALGGTSGLTGIEIASGKSISSTSGNITLSGTGGTGSPCRGILLNSASSIITAGNINITAEGGVGASNAALYLNGGNITTTGSGTITIDAQASVSSTGANNNGIYLDSGATSSYITSFNGDITITKAYAGGDSTQGTNIGIYLKASTAGVEAYISSTGSGNIFIYDARGGAGPAAISGDNTGVILLALGGNVYISTNSGETNITATGGTGINNMGVQLRANTPSSSYIKTTSNNLTINATGGTGTMNNYGIYLVDSSIYSGSGTIFITSQGGSGTGFQEGMNIFTSSIYTESGGSIEIESTGGSGTYSNYGMQFSYSSIYTTSGGDITIESTGGTGGNSNNGFNLVYTGLSIYATAQGNIDITVKSGSGDSQSIGGSLPLDIHTTTGSLTIDGTGVVSTGLPFLSGSTIYTTSGDIVLTGRSGTSGNTTYGISLTGATVSTTGGDIDITALGRSTGNNIYGLYLSSSSSISTTSATGTGNITIDAQSSATSTGATNYGLYLSSSSISSVDGDITIAHATGGGNGTSTNNYGLWVSTSSISTTGSGNIDITANGGSGTSASHGLFIDGTSPSIYAGGTGLLTINAYGGTSGTTNYGLYTNSSTASIYTAAADLIINAYGGTETSTSSNMGLRINAGSIYTTGGGNISILGQGGGTTTANTGVNLISATTSKIYTQAGGNIAITANGNGTGSTGMSCTGQIYCTTTGNIDITATGAGTSSSADGFVGGTSMTINTTTGNITILATGSGAGLGMSLATEPATGDSINTTSGKISITARGGTSGTLTYGMSLNRSTITTTGGDIEISAISRATGNTNYGLFLTASTISTTSLLGTGNIDIIATASPSSTLSNNTGLYLITIGNSPYNSSITSVDGDITITATGGGSITTPGTVNHGIYLRSATANRTSSISSTGTGSINIIATGGKGTTSNCGILLENTASGSASCFISTNSGDISINTTGGEGTTTNNIGLQLRVTSTGTSSYISTTSGNIDITAYPGSGTTDNYGIEINTKSYIKSSSLAGKHLNITATGGDGDSSNHGLYLVDALTALLDPKIESGAADINIVATGGSGTTSNGFYSTLADNVVRTTTGNISITGYATDGYGIAVDAGTVSSTAGGTITYTADTFSMSSLATFPSSTLGTFVFQPITTTLSIGIGTAAGGSWNLTDGVVDQVAYATTNFTSSIIGRSDGSHAIAVDTSSTILDDLTLRGNTVTITGGLTAAAGKNITCNIGQTAAGQFNLNNLITVSGGGIASANGGSYNDLFYVNIADQRFNINGNGGINTLRGPNANVLWKITSLGLGTMEPSGGGVVSFQNIHYAVGGSANDNFRFNDGATFYFVDGGGNFPEFNTLDYSLYTIPVTINWTDKTASNLFLGFDHIQNIVGNFVVVDPLISYEDLKNYLALNEIDTFLNLFVPLEVFLYHKYDLKDYSLIKNLKDKNKKILHALLLQKEEMKKNIFETNLIQTIPFSFNHLIPLDLFLYSRYLKDEYYLLVKIMLKMERALQRALLREEELKPKPQEKHLQLERQYLKWK